MKIDFEVGTVLWNPLTRELGRTLERTDERLVCELIAEPGARVAGAHHHPGMDERFEVLSGSLGYRIGAETGVLGAGETRTIPRGVVHDWWNAGAGSLHARVTVTPPMQFAEAIAVAWGLAVRGRTNAKGMPGPLDAALILEEFADTLVFEKPPVVVQRALVRTLAPIARRLGRTLDDETLYRAAIVEDSRWPASEPLTAPAPA